MDIDVQLSRWEVCKIALSTLGISLALSAAFAALLLRWA